MKRLLPPQYTKPQNQISENVQTAIKKEVVNWLVDFGIDQYHAGLIAGRILSDMIAERIKATHPTAPDVLLTDRSKVDSLVIASKKAIDKLDEAGLLEDLIEELVVADSQGESNSI